MTAAAPAVTVITLTRRRPQLLQRAIASAAAQRCADAFVHMVLVDDCDETCRALAAADLPPHVRWRRVDRAPWEHSGPGRSSRLRNLGVRLAATPWIAFLDDDNRWTPDHLASLLQTARDSGARAVHSQMELRDADDEPYLEPRVPWCRDDDRARAEYEELCRLGVLQPGSCVSRDRADPRDHPDPARTVDTGEWLLARELLLEVPFDDRFDADDEAAVTGEDDKLLSALVERGERIVSSGRPTLLYTLGGYSNRFDTPMDETFAWR